MRCFLAALILLLGNHHVLSSSYICRNRDYCTCRNTSQGYQFHCFSSNNDDVDIRTTSDKNIKLTCSNKELFNLEILPNYTAGSIGLFQIRYCPLSQDSLISVLEKFDIKNLKKLHLDEVVLKNESSKEIALVSKEAFQSLFSLQTLEVSRLSNPPEIDAFDNLPNLKFLYLENNNIENISGMFESLKYLKVLHLSHNSLTNIPNETFQNLPELQVLHLMKNNLTRITKSYFSGLHNLTSLDLSWNYIQSIDSDAFSDLSELVNISFTKNQLGHISSDLFREKKRLFEIRMDYNFYVTLDDYAFSNLKNLAIVNLEQSGLQNIPGHVFKGSENIQILKMQNNFLQNIPAMVFSGLKHLRELDLSENEISSIPDELFSSLVDLEIVKLGGNLISEINENIFRTNKLLTKIDLNHNRIKTIAQNSFSDHDKLIFMDFSNNLYDMENELSYAPFKNCPNLQELKLRGNHINSFPWKIMLAGHLTKLDLSHNNIKTIMVSELITAKKMTIDLSNNQISEVDFQGVEVSAKSIVKNFKNDRMPVTTVHLYNNSLVCDCRVYDLVRYIRGKLDLAVKSTLNLYLGNPRCESPEKFRPSKIKDLQLQYITCSYMGKCKSSSACECFYRPFDEAVVVDCSYKNLGECPRIEMNSEMRVEMNLTGNMIRHGPNSSLGYDNVINLFLSNNSIEQFKWVPPGTKILKLDGNQLKHLDSDVLKMLDSISNLTLSDNPWTCDCSAFDFQNFVRAKFGKESKDIVCEGGELLIEKKQLCKPMSTLIMQIVIPIFLVIVSTAIGTALYYRYQKEIEIWLPCCPPDTEEIDKKFDIFLSYSHKDEDFVHQNLLPVLEGGPDPYDICIHERNWVAGEFITKQIADSVNDSRRTLVVLSNDFLESVWGKMEFRAAHTKATKERRARVIVIKYGELDEEKLDEEMKMYLKTNTYVEWGDRWFWKKLRHALPHSRFRNKNNQKHVNMMLKIDDKFDVTYPPLALTESAPPVMGLESAALKSSSLSNKLETPPAETPLVVQIERD